MIRITDILDRVQAYMTPDEQELIQKAYVFSASVHQGQVRLSGEPYLIHPMEVAGMLTDMRLDCSTVVTGLLHDTVEDTLATPQQIEAAFGKDVAFLVEGLTKISRITFSSREAQQAENFRKMILAMSSDIRILMVRLADRIHNMRTLQYHPPDKQQRIARETLDLYAPLANRLGIYWMKVELEDLAFKYLEHNAYNELNFRVSQKQEKREHYTEEVTRIIREELRKADLVAEVEGRAKHLWSIHKKMQAQHIEFDEVYDLIAFRIILASDTVRECYAALSMIHSLWKPVPGRFKDYIAIPKANNYKSLHTTVIGPYGERMEVQIRTRAMHEWAEEGIAAHWRYKERRSTDGGEDEQIKRLRELLEVQQEVDNPREYMSTLKMALFPDEVYVFTPNGDVRAFPKGATPIDFAYSVHSDVGHTCIGAKVNRNIVPLKYQLQNGDRVEITTQAGHHPSKDWLKYAVTSRARSKIKNWVNTEERNRSIVLGRELLEKEFRKHGLKFSLLGKPETLKKIYEENQVRTQDDLMAAVGYGKLSPKHVVQHFVPEEPKAEEPVPEKAKKKTPEVSTVGISLTGIEDVMVRYAKCCTPIPGDEIVGYISRGRGIVVHTSTCSNTRDMEADRLVDVEWNVKERHTYPVHIRVVCRDRKGVLADVSSAISAHDVNISNAQVDTNNPDMQAVCDFKIDVNDLNELNKVVTSIKKLDCVMSVERLRQL
ncbi:MAG: GTP pyrophosphokinase [Deltaproteobacteria bacterium HGW-Deltaproteobacteria-19]|jgi:GTP pyrophosphokinase|nr:MAG: GTP pyrophosphokinase [Deltaproteobacteria bacterium HGW-Deltaproteobacteria-19]